MDKKELRELSIPLWDRIRKAIREGDQARALSLLDKARENAQKMRETVLDLTDLALSEIAASSGEDAVQDVMRTFCLRNIRPLFGKEWLELSVEERVRRRARGFAELHNIAFEIEEDAEKFVFKFACDTGGYLSTKEHSGRTKKAYPWSGGQRGIGYYCTHCPVSFEIMAIEDYAYPWWVTMPPSKPGERCVQYHYKNPAATPEKWYQRAGMEKRKTKPG